MVWALDGGASFVSVVVPTRNRPESVIRCVEHLARLDYPPHRLEAIVVDDGGTPSVRWLADRFRGELELTVLHQRHTGPAGARNAGVARASGSLVAFTDDDCRPAPSWLAALTARLAARPSGVAGGRTVNELRDNPWSTASQLLNDFLYARQSVAGEDARFFVSNNLALSRDLFWEVGGFDPSFRLPAGEDRDLCRRLARSGCTMAYAPDAVVSHAHPLDVAGFVRQHFGYGRGARRYRSAAYGRGDLVDLEPLRFYVDLVAFPLSAHAAAPSRKLTLAALLALSQAATAAGFAWETAQQ